MKFTALLVAVFLGCVESHQLFPPQYGRCISIHNRIEAADIPLKADIRYLNQATDSGKVEAKTEKMFPIPTTMMYWYTPGYFINITSFDTFTTGVSGVYHCAGGICLNVVNFTEYPFKSSVTYADGMRKSAEVQALSTAVFSSRVDHVTGYVVPPVLNVTITYSQGETEYPADIVEKTCKLDENMIKMMQGSLMHTH